MARTLLAGQPVSYDGDPLRDHALVSFLDKFIAKKPKVRKPEAEVVAPAWVAGHLDSWTKA